MDSPQLSKGETGSGAEPDTSEKINDPQTDATEEKSTDNELLEHDTVNYEHPTVLPVHKSTIRGSPQVHPTSNNKILILGSQRIDFR